MGPPAGEAPDQKAVDRAECQFALLRARAGILHMVEYPRNLGPREIRIEQQAGARDNARLVTSFFEGRTDVCRAAVLPHDRPVNGLSAPAIPNDRGLALVGDADAGDFLRPDPGLAYRAPACGQHRSPQVFGLMLHPPRLWKILAELLLRRRDDFAALVKNNGAGGSRALIDGENKRRHGTLLERGRISCTGRQRQ